MRVHQPKDGLAKGDQLGIPWGLQGGLMCSLNDKEVSEFIQAKTRKHRYLETKQAVSKVGCQANGIWVINETLTINTKGQQLNNS